MQIGHRHCATSLGVRLERACFRWIRPAWLRRLARPFRGVDRQLHPASLFLCILTVASASVSSSFATGSTIGPSDFIVPCRIQVPLLLKILSFDRALDTTQIDTVRIAVFFSPTTPPGVRERLEQILVEHSQDTINGRPIAYRIVTVASREQAWAELKSDPPDVVYLAGVSDEVLAGALSATRQYGILSFSAMERDVGKGVSVGLSPAGEGSNILVNLESLKLEGRKMQAGLLGVSQIVRGEQ